jgi:glycosyltransferase involved in cell wall biosynthesis
MSSSPNFFIIPAFNATATIEAAVASIQAQTVTDWAVCIIDDGSSDPRLIPLYRQMVRDPRIQVILSPSNKGPGAARNLGLDRLPAEAKLVYFMDADDLAAPDRVALQTAFFRMYPELDAAGGSVRMFGAQTGVLTPCLTPEDIAVRLLFSSEVFTNTLTIRADLLRRSKLRFLEGFETGEDWEFATRLVRHGALGNLPDVLAEYRRSEQQATTNLTDRPGDLAARLRVAQLQWLGIPTERIDIETHIAISPCYWPLHREVPPAAFSRERIAAWHDTLLSANRASGRFDEGRFVAILETIFKPYLQESMDA